MAVTQSPTPKRPLPSPERAASPLDDLHVRILKRLTQASTLTDAIADAAIEVTGNDSSLGFFHAGRTPEGELAPPVWVLAPPDARSIAELAIAACCSETLTRTRVHVDRLPGDRCAVIAAAGIYFRGRAPEVIGLVIPAAENHAALTSALQLAATSISLWGAAPRTPTTATNLAERCIAACQDAETLTAVFERVALLLGDSFAVSVCIGQKRESGGARMLATSTASRFSNSTALTRAANEAFSAILAAGEEQLWVYRDAINSEPGPLMSFALAAEAEFAFAMPLVENGAAPQFAVLLFGNVSASQIEKIAAEVRAAKPRLAAFFGLIRRIRSESHISKWFTSIANPFTGSRRMVAIPVLAAAVGLLFLPITDSAPATCTIEPLSRRFVVAPQDGLLAKSLVEPGQTVEKGQLLALLDQHALELEIASQKAAITQAQLRRDAALARGEAGQAGIFSLEAQQADENLALLELRLAQLSIRSPITGMVLRGDLQRTIGAPLEKGKVLFEVAPLEGFVAEIAIPEEEIHRVAAGMPVTARLDAFSGKSFGGELLKIYPRAEMREDVSVFIAEMRIDPQGAPIRPGMRGKASIAASRSPLLWSWIRRPVLRLIRRMGW